MVIRFSFFNTILFAALALVLPALADDLPPLDFKGVYDFRFSGVPIGRMGIESEQSPAHYAMTADVTTVGVARLFTEHESHTVVSGSGAGFAYPNVAYESRYRTKDKKKSVVMGWKEGAFGSETLVPPDNRATRPEVPAEMKKDAADPLSFNLILRKKTWEALQSGNPAFSLNVYDGRRLMRVDAAVAGKQVIRLDGRKAAAVRVALRRKPLAGYTAKELKRFDPNEPTLWIYYSDDARFIPIHLEVGFLFGKLTATLAKECRTGESCLLGIRE